MTTNHDDFWGKHGDWPEAPEGARREPRAGVGTTVSRWWNTVLGGSSTANRAHRGRYSTPLPLDLDDEPLSINPSGEQPVIRPSGEVPVTRSNGADRTGQTPRTAADAMSDEMGGDESNTAGHTSDDRRQIMVTGVEPVQKPGVDPLLARLGGAAVVLTLMVPLVLGVGFGDDEPAVNAALLEPTVVTAVAPADVASEPTTAADPIPPTTQVISTGALASSTAEREQSCAIDYTIVAGDFWIRLADEAGVPIEQLLDANDATSDTPLYPGSSICLPQGSSVPSPPTTAKPITTTPVATTANTTTPVASAPVATTATTAKPIVTYPTPSAAAVQQIIRDVWPDELEDRAIEIAARESNFVATAQNSCCYGVFQMHWNAHKGWLAGLGITSPDQLFDVTNNAYAAYALYQRSGGWGPWT